MAKEYRYDASPTLAAFELLLGAQEPLRGAVTKLRALGGQSAITFSGTLPAPQDAPVVKLMIGSSAPPAPASMELVIVGSATIGPSKVGVAVFRKS